MFIKMLIMDKNLEKLYTYAEHQSREVQYKIQTAVVHEYLSVKAADQEKLRYSY